MLRYFGQKLGMSLAMVTVLAAGPALATTQKCPTENDATVVIDFSLQSDFTAACTGAARALTYMLDKDFREPPEISIRIIDSLQENSVPVAHGHFDAKTKTATVMSRTVYQDARVQNRVLGLPMDTELYSSIFTHEVAHAIAHENFAVEKPPTVAHEYIAYTVQLATLPDALRNRILTAIPGTGFEHEREISELYMAFDPDRFAVQVYRHFMRSTNRTEFFARLLSGAFKPTPIH